MSDSIFLMEVGYYDPVGLTTGTLYFGSGKSFVSRPSDTPANKVFLPCVVDPGSFSRYLFQQNTTRGRSQINHGNVVLNNAKGQLDFMLNYAFDSRPVTIYYGDPTLAAYPSGLTKLFSGTMQQVTANWNQINIVIFDQQGKVANQLIESTVYLGTNSGSTGLEGLPADIGGKYKPCLYGDCSGGNGNIPAVPVNSVSLTYQISERQIASIQVVYDKGVALTVGTARASLALLIANTPAASHYDYYLGSGSDGAYFKLGSTPAGQVTVDATEGAAGSDRTVAQIIKRILKGPGGLTNADLDLASFTALDTANSAPVGIWLDTGGSSIGAAIDQLCGSVGAYWTQTRAGLISVGQLALPSGSADLEIKQYQITKTIERVSSNDPGAVIPIWRVQLFGQRNYQVQNPVDIAGAAFARIQQVANEYRNQVYADVSVLTTHPMSQTLPVNTQLAVLSNMLAEATRLQILYGTRRDMINIQVPRMIASLLELNDVVKITCNRFGYNSGKKFILIGITEQYTQVTDILQLWGGV